MDTAPRLRAALAEVGQSVRRPERLARAWDGALDARPDPWVLPCLVLTAALGMAAYGVVMRLHLGAGGMLEGAVRAPLAAGLAWAIALPALHILGGATGSRLSASTAVFAASITVAFGGLAMLASVPVAWFFGLALPHPVTRLATHLLVFSGVGLCMADTFLRVMAALEPTRGRAFPTLWLGLVGLIGLELFVLLDVFTLA